MNLLTSPLPTLSMSISYFTEYWLSRPHPLISLTFHAQYFNPLVSLPLFISPYFTHLISLFLTSLISPPAFQSPHFNPNISLTSFHSPNPPHFTLCISIPLNPLPSFHPLIPLPSFHSPNLSPPSFLSREVWTMKRISLMMTVMTCGMTLRTRVHPTTKCLLSATLPPISSRG